MKKQPLERIKKKICVLLLISVIMSTTVTAVNAVSFKNDPGYQRGYQAGAKDGYRVGYDGGNQDCNRYRKNSVITRIPNPVNEAGWGKLYKDGYNSGFKDSYIVGYNKARFKCIQK
jgi:hypothetical protein